MASEGDLFHAPHSAKPATELRLNVPQVPNNKLMNTGVAFYFSSACLDSIHCHKGNEIHLKRRPFCIIFMRTWPEYWNEIWHANLITASELSGLCTNIDSGLPIPSFSSPAAAEDASSASALVCPPPHSSYYSSASPVCPFLILLACRWSMSCCWSKELQRSNECKTQLSISSNVWL